eukprot:TRINITY_DN2373_c0_g1_i3.p1 TRINITY_DN2373_c0_g1~~TRINITY_DN2373_c0_g1_i3.p1  ORF type:complete len:457 (-),score=101.79 TRINITY_DN2373_c0_g1_i3:189-1559(-)
MGALNCTKSLRIEDEVVLEASLIKLSHNDSINKQKSIYQTLSQRISLSKEDFLELFKKNPLYNVRNYDPYYGLLVTHVLSSQTPCSTCGSVEETKTCSTDSKPKSKIVTSASSSSFKLPLKFKGFAASSPMHLSSTNSLLPKQLNRKRTAANTIPKAKPRNFSIMTNDEYKTKLDIISLLPEHVICLIFSYVANQYSACLKVSVPWYVSLQTSLDSLFKPLIHRLCLRYSKYISFHSSFTTFTKQNKGSDRIDRVIRLQLLSNSPGKTLTIGYKYKFANERNTYMTTYKVDCRRKDQRTFWIHAHSKNSQITIHNIGSIPISSGDIFEIAINYYTLRGLIDVGTVTWTTPLLREEEVGEKECELEQLNGGVWYDSKYYDKMTVRLAALEKLFNVVSVEYSPIDVKTKRITLSACKTGKNKSECRDDREGGDRSEYRGEEQGGSVCERDKAHRNNDR